MLRLACTLLALAFATPFAQAAGAVAPSREEAMKAIETLERRLFSDEAVEALVVITRFVELSDDVFVYLAPETIPWMEEQPDGGGREEALRAMLLGVYFAGNSKAQLAAGRADDRPYEGWLAVIKAYREIQRRAPFSSEGIDELIDLQESGQLQSHARKVKASLRQTEPSPII